VFWVFFSYVSPWEKNLKTALEVPHLPWSGGGRDVQPQQEARMLHYWMSQLEAAAKADRDKRQAERDEKARAEADPARVRLTPLEDRLTRLLATIPLEVQREGLSLSSLQASLRGRWRGNAHPGDVGRALRRLGFERRRNWAGDADGFRALRRKVRRDLGSVEPDPLASVAHEADFLSGVSTAIIPVESGAAGQVLDSAGQVCGNDRHCYGYGYGYDVALDVTSGGGKFGTRSAVSGSDYGLAW
jgi:hypothetical protein